MTAHFIVVRHGNTFEPDELPRRIGLRTDLPLVESGRAQAARLAAWFVAQDVRFDRALSSPLRRRRGELSARSKRTLETAGILLAAQAGSPNVEANALLAEIDHGPDEDQYERDVIGRIGAEALNAWDRAGIAPPGWAVDREARIAGWANLLAEPRSSTTLLVTSNGAARFALMAHPDLAAQAATRPSLKLRTGAFGLIQVNADGPRLMEWDQRP